MDLRKELNETKSQVVVAEYKRETDIQNQDRKAQEEISSLQHLVHGKFDMKKENLWCINKNEFFISTQKLLKNRVF